MIANPADYRDENFRRIESRLSGMRLRIHRALLLHGPCTTMQLAQRAGISILAVRPRVTELCGLGLAEIAPAFAPTKREGAYRAITLEEATARHFARLRAQARKPRQLALEIGA